MKPPTSCRNHERISNSERVLFEIPSRFSEFNKIHFKKIENDTQAENSRPKNLNITILN